MTTDKKRISIIEEFIDGLVPEDPVCFVAIYDPITRALLRPIPPTAWAVVFLPANGRGPGEVER